MAVKDAFKALFRKQKELNSPPPRKGEIGWTGNKIFSGLPMDEYNPDLVFPSSTEVYDRMRRSDGQVAAVLNAMKLPIRATKWYVEPDDVPEKDKKTAEQIAEFVEDNLMNGMKYSWDDHLREALLMLDFGLSVFEKVWRFDTWHGRRVVMLDKYAPRVTPSIWRFPQDENYNIVEIEQINYMTGQIVNIPLDKCRVYTYQREGENIVGISALRPAYKHWFIKDALYNIVAVGIEKSLIGTPYGQLPAGTSDEDETKVLNLLTAVRVAEASGFTIPEGVTVGMLEGSKNAVDALPFIEHMDTQIARSVLAQFINLGTMSSASGGSYALGNTMVGMFIQNLDSIANYIAGEVQKDIETLVEWNFGANAPVPHLKHGNISIDSVAERLAAIAAVGSGHLLNPDEELENVIRGLIGVPPISKQALDNQLLLPPNRYEPEIVPDGTMSPQMIADAQKQAQLSKMPSSTPGATPIKVPPSQQQPTRATEGDAGIQFADTPPNGQNQPKQPTETTGQWRRELTPYEDAAALAALDAWWQAADKRLHQMMQSSMRKIGDDLILKIKHIVESASTPAEALRKVTALTTQNEEEYHAHIKIELTKAYEHGIESAAKELHTDATKVPKSELSVASIESKADALSKLQVSKMLAAVKMETASSLERGLPDKKVVDNAQKAADDYADGHDLKTAAQVSISQALNVGRGVTAHEVGVQGAQWSAVLDSHTCPLCEELDGKVIKADNPDFDTFRPPIHFGCRCFMAYILLEEENVVYDWKQPDPALVKKYGGFVT